MFWEKIRFLRTADNPLNTDETITLLLNRSNEFTALLESGVKDAAQKAGYTLNTVDSLNSATLQLDQVEGARKRGEKAIIINLVDPIRASDALKKAGGMKVVFLNRVPVDMSILNKNAAFIGPNDLMVGKLQGEWLVKYFNKKGKNDIKYILLEGIPDWPTTIKRTKSALQALADGGIKASEAVPPIIANYDLNQAMTKLLPVLSAGVKFDAIISNDSEMALGAIKAFEHLGMDPSKVPIVTVNATPKVMEAIRVGKLAMSVFQRPIAQGSTSITVVTNMLQGKPFNEGTGYDVLPDNPYVLYIPLELVTRYHIPSDLYFTV